MRITEVVRVQNPMGGDYKSQLDRDRAAAAVRAQRQANREIPNRGAVSGAKSGTDPQGSMFTPGAVTTKSYNNALTKQFARPAGQGKGLDLMGKPLQQPVQRKIEPAQQIPTPQTTQAAKPEQSWVGQNTNVPAVQRKQQAQQAQQTQQQPNVTTTQQPTTQTAAQPTVSTGTSTPVNAPTNTQSAQSTGQVQGVKQKINPAFVKEFDGIVDVSPKLTPHVLDAKARSWVKTNKGWQSNNLTVGPDDPTYIAFDNAWREANGFPPAKEGTKMGSTANNQPQQEPAQQTQQPTQQAQPTQTMPNEPVKIGGQKLNPNDPSDAKMLQMIQKQLPQMPTPQVAAVKKVADKTLNTRKRNKPKKRF
jgi:hypothetical protein